MTDDTSRIEGSRKTGFHLPGGPWPSMAAGIALAVVAAVVAVNVASRGGDSRTSYTAVGSIGSPSVMPGLDTSPPPTTTVHPGPF